MKQGPITQEELEFPARMANVRKRAAAAEKKATVEANRFRSSRNYKNGIKCACDFKKKEWTEMDWETYNTEMAAVRATEKERQMHEKADAMIIAMKRKLKNLRKRKAAEEAAKQS